MKSPPLLRRMTDVLLKRADSAGYSTCGSSSCGAAAGGEVPDIARTESRSTESPKTEPPTTNNLVVVEEEETQKTPRGIARISSSRELPV